MNDADFLAVLRTPRGQDPSNSDVQHLLELAQSGALIHVDEAEMHVAAQRMAEAAVRANREPRRDPLPTHDDAHPEGWG